MKTMVRTVLGALVMTGLALPVAAQDAGTIVERMLAEYERRAEGVANYTLVQEVMGFETLSYYEKETVDGRSVFHLRSTSAGGVQGSASGGRASDIYLMGDELVSRAEYVGRETIEGREVYVLDIDDLSDMGLDQEVSPDSEFTPTRGRLYLDADSYVPRRMEFDGVMTNDEGAHDVTSTVDMRDYRAVEGFLVAYRTTIAITGLGAAIDPEMRAQFEEMQRELENMPAQQRRMVESMMAAQLEQFRSMMDGGDGPMTIEMTVQEVRVNQGPPRR